MMHTHNCFRSLLLLLAPSTLFLLMSCQSEPDDAPATEGQCTVSFSVSNYRQISFDDLSSSAISRASSQVVMDLANLSLTVFNADTNEKISTLLHKSSDYDDSAEKAKTFPQFSLTLPYGHYRVLVLGYNGSRACNITSVNQISWEENYVPNTFLYSEEITLDKDANLNREITLKHVVAAFCLTAKDANPAELKKMRFKSSAGGTVLDATSGFTPLNSGRTSDIVIPPNHIGVIDTFTVYYFLPEEQINSNLTVQAIDKNDKVLNEKHFNNVPLRINNLTIWEGKLFEASSPDEEAHNVGISLYWDTQWADTLKI